ncbi:hypothetical protein AB4Y75_15555 [Arthrobacter sp. RAF14]
MASFVYLSTIVLSTIVLSFSDSSSLSNSFGRTFGFGGSLALVGLVVLNAAAWAVHALFGRRLLRMRRYSIIRRVLDLMFYAVQIWSASMFTMAALPDGFPFLLMGLAVGSLSAWFVPESGRRNIHGRDA